MSRRLIIRGGRYSMSVKFTISDSEAFMLAKDHLKNLTLARWDPDEKQWIVDMSLFPSVKQWAQQHFQNEEITYIPPPAPPPKPPPPPPPPPRPGSKLQQAYSALYVVPDAPMPVITAAHRALSKLHHPDTGQGDHVLMAAINNALDEIKKVRV